jgi:cationic peptide transport system substrate-binding protein
VQLPSLIKDIVALNEHRIDIYLNRPDSSFLSNLATDFAVILSAEYAQNLTNTEAKERIDFFPVGTGPFKFQNYQSNRYIRYVRHEEYWGQPQSLSQLVYDITPSSSKRLAKLLTSECDVMSLPSYADLAVLQQKEVITYNQRSGLNVGFWAFNTSKKPFDNPKIRKALAMAIDKNAILETIYANTGTRAKGIIPPASWAYHAHIGDYSYNPVAARKLLAEANLSENFAMTIWAMPLQRHYNPDAIRMAELIRDYLSQVNITATIVSDEWTTFRKRLKAGVYDSVLIGWTADNSDPDNFFRTLLSCDAIQSGTNRARWCSEEYDDYINQAIQYSNTKDRNIFYEKASEIIQEQVPLVPIAHALHYQAFRSEVSGLRINPHGGIRFSGVGIDYRLSEK